MRQLPAPSAGPFLEWRRGGSENRPSLQCLIAPLTGEER